MGKIVVLFEVKPTAEGLARYKELGAMLRPMLNGFEGFISGAQYVSSNVEGKLLSINTWESEEAVERWRNTIDHRMSQREGREKLFEYYRITVCNALREYTDTDRAQAPADSNAFHCAE